MNINEAYNSKKMLIRLGAEGVIISNNPEGELEFQKIDDVEEFKELFNLTYTPTELKSDKEATIIGAEILKSYS